jgi:hypothetical protein
LVLRILRLYKKTEMDKLQNKKVIIYTHIGCIHELVRMTTGCGFYGMLKIPKEILVSKIHGHFSQSFFCFVMRGLSSGYCQRALVGE